MNQLDKEQKHFLFRWIGIGIAAFLTILFIFLNVVFNKPTKELVEEDDDGFVKLPLEEELDQPIFNIDESLPEIEEFKGEFLKENVWSLLMGKDYDSAIIEMQKAYDNHNLADNEELLAWYSDVGFLGVLDTIPKANQADALGNFQVPRFQAVFPVFTSALTLATLISDSNSLIPIDVDYVQLLSEEWLTPEECQEISPYMTQQLDASFETVYKATLRINDDEIDAYVGIFAKNQKLKLFGYYGESETLETDEYWETHREAFSRIPIFNQ